MTSAMNRQVIAVVALIGFFISVYLLLYKLGAFGTLICGDSGCIEVQNSPWAYFLGLPVAAWGVVGYLAMLIAALVGIRPRLADRREVSIALLGLTGAAFLFSVYLSVIEEFVIGVWCQWCIASAVLAALAFGFALPEVKRLRR
jgi:uncharacterized membrane protein